MRCWVSYLIEVERNLSTGKGKLTYTQGAVSVSTDCWFELANPIPARKYTLCSATLMNSKKNSTGGKREGIYLPDDQTGRGGIFIHMGRNSSWSDGCIVIVEQELLKIWNSIPKNGNNVSINVTNK